MEDRVEYSVLAFYQFLKILSDLETVQKWRDELECFLRSVKASGSCLLAVEGVNGTICYPTEFDAEVKIYLLNKFPLVMTRLSVSDTVVFHRLKVRIRNEIVTMGTVDAGNEVVRPTQTGKYVAAGPEWDDLLFDPECLVVDTRNEYEIQLGTFEGAENPHTEAFPEFPAWLESKFATEKPKKVAMFCTGGIRCEKATAFCRSLAPDLPVYHLKGGILAYLDTVPQHESKFKGDCYVFDQRIAVSHGLKVAPYKKCHACRHVLTVQDLEADEYEEGIQCAYCASDKQLNRKRHKDRQKQILLSCSNGIPHIHDSKQNM